MIAAMSAKAKKVAPCCQEDIRLSLNKQQKHKIERMEIAAVVFDNADKFNQNGA